MKLNNLIVFGFLATVIAAPLNLKRDAAHNDLATNSASKATSASDVSMVAAVEGYKGKRGAAYNDLATNSASQTSSALDVELGAVVEGY